MARGRGVDLGMDASGAHGMMGFIDGLTGYVRTPFYINAVLRYTHARLSNFFDLWLDNEARMAPQNLQHVYEWPQEYHEYGETVGNPGYRLWEHTLKGVASNAHASFNFLPSRRPSPVNPILLEPGPTGKHVKENVHVFVWKAMVMEYGLPVEIEPKLAKMLAYVIRDRTGYGDDFDAGRHPNAPEDEGGEVMLSKGPVNIDQSGGAHTKRQFSTRFQIFYRSLALDHLKKDILPDLEHDLGRAAREMGTKGILGKRSQKKRFSIEGSYAANKASWQEAKEEAERILEAQGNEYIKEAAARRRHFYGA